jgi:hypothetical protein
MSQILLAALPYLLLLAESAALAAYVRKGTVSVLAAAGLTILNLVARILSAGAISALISAGTAALLLLILIFTGVLNRTNTFVLPALLVAAPMAGWWIVPAAFVASGLVGAVRVAMKSGTQSAKSLVVETTLATQSLNPSQVQDTLAAADRTQKTNLLAYVAVFTAVAAVLVSLIG